MTFHSPPSIRRWTLEEEDGLSIGTPIYSDFHSEMKTTTAMTDTDVLAADELPAALTDLSQWVCWREEDRDGKATKVPIDPDTGQYASTTDPETWTGLKPALDRDDVDGVGFVFTEDGPFVGIDLDDCRNSDTGEPMDDARTIVDQLDSYTEVSPSGTGYHVLLRGNLPSGGNRSGNVEMYDSARFFTVTGDHVAGTPSEIRVRSDALASVHKEYVQDDSREKESASMEDSTSPDVALSDEELLGRAQEADNGKKFQQLWRGSTQGYESQSEADMALCCQLAFWTGGDMAQMDRLFQRSGLMREKWDEIHYSDGSTYGEKTIERAIQQTSEFYNPSHDSEQEPWVSSPASDVNANGMAQAGESNPSAPRSDQRLQQRIATTETTLEHLEQQLTELKQETEDLREQLRQEQNARDALSDQVEALNVGSLRMLMRQLLAGVLK